MHPRKPQRGFTMVELLVVIVIVGILAAVAVPLYLAQRTKAKDAAVKSGVRSLEIGLAAYATDHDGVLPPTGDLAVLKGSYVESWPVDPFNGGPMAYSSTPAAGGYDYVLGDTSYSLTGWLDSGDFRVTGAASGSGASYASVDGGTGGSGGSPAVVPPATPVPSTTPDPSTPESTPTLSPTPTPTPQTPTPEPTVTPAPSATSFAAVSDALVSLLQAYNKENDSWPRSWGNRPYTDLGLDPGNFDSPIGHVYYRLTGSQILISPAPGYVITVTDTRGRTQTLTAKSEDYLIYDGDHDAWYLGSVRSGNKVDVSTFTVERS